MTVYHATIPVLSHGGTPSFVDVTEDVRAAVAASGIENGLCAVISAHTTCSVYFDEWAHDALDDGTDFLQNDLNRILTGLAPDQDAFPPAHGYRYPGEEHFRAVESWPSAEQYLPGGDRGQLLNADAHLKSSLLGTSQTFQVAGGGLTFGVTGYIFFVDWDRARPRTRSCLVTVIGE